MIKKAGILALALVAFSACEKDSDSDTTKPVIAIETPTNDQEFAPGDAIPFKGSITDNEELSSFKVDIHWGADHDHGKLASQWDHEQTWSISGTLFEFDESITIPGDADHGEYHMIVYATDKSGNEAEFVTLDLIIEDD